MTSGASSPTLIMGVLNVTPDSFSDGGKYSATDAALAHARLLRAQGADLIDVGGESTRPGATPISPEEEQRRVIPVVEALAAERFGVSVDTLNASTAALAVRAGATYINDVSGGLHDAAMFDTIAQAGDGVDLIIGHWRGFPDPNHERSHYDDVVAEVCEALAVQRDLAVTAGIAPERIILDPGLGFDKTGDQCWELFAAVSEIGDLGHRVLVGTSRKRMLREVLEGLPEAARDLEPAGRDLATAVTSAFAQRGGAWGVRVHDVAGNLQALAVERAMQQRAETVAAPAASADRISLTGLEVFAHHGVFDFEREAGQTFIIDVELDLDARGAARSDDLGRTVDYGELAAKITEAVERDPVDLIETVAERVCSVALGFDPVSAVRATVHKPGAPIQAVFADVSVTVERLRGRRAR